MNISQDQEEANRVYEASKRAVDFVNQKLNEAPKEEIQEMQAKAEQLVKMIDIGSRMNATIAMLSTELVSMLQSEYDGKPIAVINNAPQAMTMVFAAMRTMVAFDREVGRKEEAEGGK